MNLREAVKTWSDPEQMKFWMAAYCRKHPYRFKKVSADQWFFNHYGQSISDYRNEVKLKLET